MRINTFTSRENRTSYFIPLLLLILLAGKPALAHVEKGSMPDPVAEMEYRILLEFTPYDLATRSLLGMALLRQSKFAEAEKEFRLILHSDPKNFDALDSLGLILFKLKRNREALQTLRTAVKIRPDDIMVHLHLGLTLASDGQTEMARNTLTTGLNLLRKAPSASANEQQMAEFTAALATLPKKTGTASLH